MTGSVINETPNFTSNKGPRPEARGQASEVKTRPCTLFGGTLLRLSARAGASHFLIVSISALGFFLTGCAPQPISLPPAPSHVALDASLASAKQHLGTASASLNKAQAVVTLFATAPHDATIGQEIVDLKSDLADLGSQLTGVTSDLATTSASLTWYEGAAKQAWEGWQATAKQLSDANIALQKAQAAESAQRKKAWFWRLIVLGEIACVGIWLGLKYGGPYLAKLGGAFVKA